MVKPSNWNPSKTATRLERLWWSDIGGWYIERFDDEEQAFYGSSVAEGICPDLHGDDPELNAEGSADLRPRMLHLRADGWLECEDGARWRFVS